MAVQKAGRLKVLMISERFNSVYVLRESARLLFHNAATGSWSCWRLPSSASWTNRDLISHVVFPFALRKCSNCEGGNLSYLLDVPISLYITH